MDTQRVMALLAGAAMGAANQQPALPQAAGSVDPRLAAFRQFLAQRYAQAAVPPGMIPFGRGLPLSPRSRIIPPQAAFEPQGASDPDYDAGRLAAQRLLAQRGIR